MSAESLSSISSVSSHDSGQFAPTVPHSCNPLDDARRCLAEWLLSSSVVRAMDGGSMGVVNWLEEDSDDYDGFYPEIGGYYLSFLSLVAGVDAPEPRCIQLARGVLDWFNQAGQTVAPATIERRLGTVNDWRNACLFTFDLAMIVRGMMMVDERWPGLVSKKLLDRYASAIVDLQQDQRLGSHCLRDPHTLISVPNKWSTRVDVHHVKAAAALQGVDHPVSTLARATLDHWRSQEPSKVRELHPALYMVEGWLIVWASTGDPADLARAAVMFAAVLDTLDPVSMVLPAVAGEAYSSSRGDAQAQLLRAGAILETAHALAPRTAECWEQVRDGVIRSLLSRISPIGGIRFDLKSGHRNSWASMFAWQALELCRDGERRAQSKQEAARLI